MASKTVSAQKEEVVQKPLVSEEDVIWSLKQLMWILDETLRAVERYYQAQVRYLRARDVDVISTSKLVPTKKGLRLIIDVKVPDETVLFFAENQGVLSRLIRDKRISVRKAKIIKESKKALGSVMLRIGSSQARDRDSQ